MPGTTDYVQILTWVPSADEATELARSVVHARLAAAAQVAGPAHSFYWWDGSVQEDMQEWQVQMKTTLDLYPAIEAHIKARHSYQTPGIIAVPIVAGSADYLRWISAETTRSDV
ncbi:divalent-cation tolerance protein CutA [Streptosporangiaceae bacterium NEAU-GS5]|nr:divalent-cation tolerance protein CutA [Streptosporangiaceae bacterium NEAU-GS5]